MATIADLLTSKIPPHSLEAERSVLGGMLLDRESLPQALELLKPSDFYKEGHRKMFDSMLALFERDEPADLLTISEELRRRSELDEVGGAAALGELVEEAATATNLLFYGAIVREKAALREMIRLGTDLIGQGYENGQPAAALVEGAQRQLESLAKRTASALHEPTGKVLSGPELFALPIFQPDWAVQGLFSRAHQHMIVGPSQGSKTWVLFDFAIAISDPNCSHFLGQPVCVHGPVEIESWEQGQAEDIRRLQKLIRGRGLAGGSEDLRLVSDPPATLWDASYFGRRRRELQERGVSFYLIDSLSEAAGIELNDNTAYTEFWRSRVKPLLDLGITVVFTHLRGHAKPGVANDRDSASRGATQIRALSTAVLEVRQTSDTIFMLKHNKYRDSTALSFGHLELEGGNADDWIRLAIREDAGAGGKDSLARRLLTQLGRNSALAGTRLTRKAIEASLNDSSRPKAERVSKKIYEAVLGQMVTEGRFRPLKVGNADTWIWVGAAEGEDDESPF